MEKTKSCKRKMRIAIGIILLEFAYMLFMGIGGVHATKISMMQIRPLKLKDIVTVP